MTCHEHGDIFLCERKPKMEVQAYYIENEQWRRILMFFNPSLFFKVTECYGKEPGKVESVFHVCFYFSTGSIQWAQATARAMDCFRPNFSFKPVSHSSSWLILASLDELCKQGVMSFGWMKLKDSLFFNLSTSNMALWFNRQQPVQIIHTGGPHRASNNHIKDCS